MLRRAVWTAALIVLGARGAQAQFFAVCESGRPSELQESIKAHQEHVLRLSKKFEDVWYFQGPLPAGARKAPGLDAVQRFLRRLESDGRRPGILFYSYDAVPGRADAPLKLCTWLVTAGAASPEITSHVAIVDVSGLKPLQPRLLVGGRGAEVVGGPAGRPGFEAGIRRLSEVLLPPPISAAILGQRLDTLVVVPVTITIPVPSERGRATEMLAALGTTPFSLLRLGPARDTPLLDVASVTMAPGFAAMEEPAPARAAPAMAAADAAVVVGDPANPAYAPLPGARDEAADVAAQLGTRALLGSEATRSGVLGALRAAAARVTLILFATHGVADSANPLDGSYLVLHDGRLTAREISTLRLARRPLVILSACETGAGRDFEAGTIGLARAWQRAGSPSVVMSLWRVDDMATRELITDLVRRLASAPPDRALQAAMQAVRERQPDPALWAGFSVFGLP